MTTSTRLWADLLMALKASIVVQHAPFRRALTPSIWLARQTNLNLHVGGGGVYLLRARGTLRSMCMVERVEPAGVEQRIQDALFLSARDARRRLNVRPHFMKRKRIERRLASLLVEMRSPGNSLTVVRWSSDMVKRLPALNMRNIRSYSCALERDSSHLPAARTDLCGTSCWWFGRSTVGEAGHSRRSSPKTPRRVSRKT